MRRILIVLVGLVLVTCGDSRTEPEVTERPWAGSYADDNQYVVGPTQVQVRLDLDYDWTCQLSLFIFAGTPDAYVLLDSEQCSYTVDVRRVRLEGTFVIQFPPPGEEIWVEDSFNLWALDDTWLELRFPWGYGVVLYRSVSVAAEKDNKR
jgi:hypothetical protein